MIVYYIAIHMTVWKSTVTRKPDPPRSVVAKGTHPLAHRWEPWSKDPKH